MLPERRKTAEEIAKLRESIGIPGATPDEPEEVPAAEIPAPAEDLPPPPDPKPVRSLRKSEQKPVARKVVATQGKPAAIPARRHTDRELMEMRRSQAAPPEPSIAYLRQLAVPWPLVVLGYLLPITGALAGWFAVWSPRQPESEFPAMWIGDLSRQPWIGQAGFLTLVGGCVLGLALAGGIAWKKPRSRHHAGFITIIAVLVAVFGIIHQFSSHGP